MRDQAQRVAMPGALDVNDTVDAGAVNHLVVEGAAAPIADAPFVAAPHPSRPPSSRRPPSYQPTGWRVLDRPLALVDRLSGDRAGWGQRFVSYFFIGGFAAGVNLVAFTLLYYRLQLPVDERSLPFYEAARYLIVFTIATEISTMTNFVINDHVTFSALPEHARHWYARCARFHLTALTGMLITLAVSYALLTLGAHATVAEAVAIAIAFVCNFILHHLFTYRRSHGEQRTGVPNFPNMAYPAEQASLAQPGEHRLLTTVSAEAPQPAAMQTGAALPATLAPRSRVPASLTAESEWLSAVTSRSVSTSASSISASMEVPMKLSIVIPAQNEEGAVRSTVELLYDTLTAERISFEILVVNDHSSDATETILQQLCAELPEVRYVNNLKSKGFGRAIQTGLERFTGDAVCIVMADASDDAQDVVRYYRKLQEGYDCVFGSRFMSGSRVVDYPRHKLLINRVANWFVKRLFRLKLNDTTNAFKAYRRHVIAGVSPIISPHFNITVELPLKAIVRGYTYAVVPINWYNRKTGVSKLKIKEMGSRYLFIVLSLWLEKRLAGGDYRRPQVQSDGSREPEYALEVYDTAPISARFPQTQAHGGHEAGFVPSGMAVADTPMRGHGPMAAKDGNERGLDKYGSGDELDERPQTNERGDGITLPLVAIVCAVPLLLISFIAFCIWTKTGHVPFWDEWETVTLVQHFMQGTLQPSEIWAFHNEHRIVIPRFVNLTLIMLTNWNRQAEMTFDLVVAIAEVALLFAALKRSLLFANLLLVLVVPISLLLFSFAQFQDWLAPFQITFTATVFGVACCVWGFAGEQIGWRRLAVAILGATIAALSSAGGTVAFVAFLPAVLRGGYRKTGVWVAACLAVLVPYFQGFPHGVGVALSFTTVKYALAYMGAPVGYPHVSVSMAAGAVSFMVVVGNLALYWYLHRNVRGVEVWIGLGLFTLGVATITTLGRLAMFGLEGALSSRYQTFSALWWLTLIALAAINIKDIAIMGVNQLQTSRYQVLWTLASFNVVALVGVTIALVAVNLTTIHEIVDYQSGQIASEQCAIDYPYAPPLCLEVLYPNAYDVQQRAAFLDQQHLGVFSGNPTRMATPYPAVHPLTRYFNGTSGDHWTTVSYNVDMRDGYSPELTLGYLYVEQQPNTRPLYECLLPEDHFLSLQSDCEGQGVIGLVGWLYASASTNVQTIPVYRCYTGKDHFASNRHDCEGTRFEGLLGYALSAP